MVNTFWFVRFKLSSLFFRPSYAFLRPDLPSGEPSRAGFDFHPQVDSALDSIIHLVNKSQIPPRENRWETRAADRIDLINPSMD
jgi:hypothetical protein